MNKNNYSGEYQDIEIKGDLLKKGKRECANRWEIIKPHIKPNSAVVDIGSFHGYFGIKIAREIENTTVLSFERNPIWAEEQAKIVQENNLINMAVGKHNFSLNDLKWLDTVVEGIDYFMMFSVLEYFPNEDIEEIIKYISKMCRHFIVEFPNKEEHRAAGQVAIQKFSPFIEYLKKHFDDVKVIGKSIATTDSTMTRNIYLAENKQIRRNELKSNKDNFGSRDHLLKYENNKWLMKEVDDQEREWTTGFNLHNLLQFNILYPTPQWFLDNARIKYQEIFDKYKNISDVSLKNILFTSKELKVIDYLEKNNIGTQQLFDKNFKRFVVDLIIK